jgi:hypothetical protein
MAHTLHVNVAFNTFETDEILDNLGLKEYVDSGDSNTIFCPNLAQVQRSGLKLDAVPYTYETFMDISKLSTVI